MSYFPESSPLIDPDIAYKFYSGDEAESPAVAAAETLVDLAQIQPYLYKALEARFDRIKAAKKPWADAYFSTVLKTFRILYLSAQVWEEILPLITPEEIEKYQNLMRSFLKKNKPGHLLPVIKINGGDDLISLVCADAQWPAAAEIFGITDVFLPWQAALSASRRGSPYRKW